jgi:hydroxymethylglutaryl-CoA lyase
MPARATIYEVGPRDGLQNEARLVPTPDKVAFIDALAATGLQHIEITSFVNPKWIPQLADGGEVARAVKRHQDVAFSCLVPNRKGLDAALSAGMTEIAVFLSASETHNKKNVNKTIADTLTAFEDVVEPAKQAGVRVRAYVSTVYGCPYEGDVDPKKAVELVRILRQMGVYQVSLGDTIGVANPVQVERVLEMVLAEVPQEQIAMHFHDTRGTALANCTAGLALGVETIDASVGGLGGCPYAPGASGNLATEDLVAMLHAMDIQTGVDLDKLVGCAQLIAAFVGHELPSKYLKAHLGRAARTQRASAIAKTKEQGAG